MDKIEKIINIDNSRSHRNGLLPFVHYDENKISFVNEQMPNGNYGKYVCDLTIFEKNNDEYIETNRMKYLDIIRRYSFVHKVLKNGVLVKKINFEEININKIDCVNDIEYSPIEDYRFITDFDEINDKVLCEYTPLDITFFNNVNSIYSLNKSFSELNEDIKEKIESNTFFILITNYDDVIELNNLWVDWVDIENWREVVFGADNKNCRDMQFYSDVNKYILGLTEVPSKYDGSLVPQYIDYFKCAESIEWFENNSASTINAETLKTEKNEWIINNWNERGGGDFYNFLKEISPIWQSKNDFIQIGDKNSNKYFKYTEPFININILINSEYDYETLYDVYEYSAKNNVIEGAVKPYTTTGNLKKGWLSLTDDAIPTMCESKLNTLKHNTAVMISDKIFGIYSVYDDENPEIGQMFKCTKCSGTTSPEESEKQIVCLKNYDKEYYWWECEKVTDENILNNIKCGDGEYIEGDNSDKYRNVTILSCIESVAGYVDYGKAYYFLSRYDNSEEKPIKPPYVSGVPVNIVTYDNGDVVYDKIFSIDYTDDGMAIIKYANGITSGATEMESGIHYEEILSCELNKKTTVPIDGVYMAEVYYDEIGFDGDKVEIYSDEYKLSRKTNLARILGMEIGTQWTEESAVDAMLITRDGSEGLQEEPKYNLNLLYNRGNAAAYESHFKLSECNTMEDLENYSNNFFNL